MACWKLLHLTMRIQLLNPRIPHFIQRVSGWYPLATVGRCIVSTHDDTWIDEYPFVSIHRFYTLRFLYIYIYIWYANYIRTNIWYSPKSLDFQDIDLRYLKTTSQKDIALRKEHGKIVLNMWYSNDYISILFFSWICICMWFCAPNLKSSIKDAYIHVHFMVMISPSQMFFFFF